MPLNLSPTQLAFNARGDGTFNVPFQEQVDFLKQKLNLPTAHWDDILTSAHDRGFIVAGAAKADLLADFHTAINQAVADGKSIGWFKNQFESIVQKHGWEGWTGSDTQAGRDWRARVIYNTNMRASYAAGRYAQLTDPELLQSRPYWKYIHNDTVAHPRPLHQRWNGTVLKYDDPFWSSHYPPNGFGCRCRIAAVRPTEYKGHPAPDDGTYEKTDRNGVVHVLPKGVDYGWDYAPGQSVQAQLTPVINAKIQSLPKPLGNALKANLNIPKQLDDYIALGKIKADSIINAVGNGEIEFRAELNRLLNKEVGTDISANIVTYGSRSSASKLVADASKLLPNSWTKAIDDFGSLTVRESTKRAFAFTAKQDYTGKKVDFKKLGFGVQKGSKNAGFIVTNKGSLSTALHELSHRVQSALPDLDRIFQDLHVRRTSGDALKRLADIHPFSGYNVTEVCKEDHYINAYFGKEYTGEALEVMTMSIESVMTKKYVFNELLSKDRELFDLVIGLLFHYAP